MAYNKNDKQLNDKNHHVVIIKPTYYLQLNNVKTSLHRLAILLTFLLCHRQSTVAVSAHFIQIDHNEFRASGFPKPPLPPPLHPLESIQHHLPAKELTPGEFMVDLTNDLTYRILHYHSILNRNNFAFSPTHLMSVLVALYEGAGGRSAMELKNVLQFPNNKDVIRVGYRDIHRRLRTYFFGSDNPLKGLSLNRENVTITKDYETILMFYGYDLGMDMVSPAVPLNETTTPMTPMTSASEAPAENTMTTVQPQTETTESSKETETSTTSTAANTETTPAASTTTEKTTETTTTSIASETETTTTTTSATEEAETTTEAAETTTVAPQSGEESESDAAAAPPAGGDEAAELVSSFVAEEAAEPLLRIQKARVTRLPSGKLQAPPPPSPKSNKSKNAAITLPRNNYLPSARGGSVALTTAPSSRRRPKRHLFNNLKEVDASLFVSLFQPHSAPGIYAISGPSPPPPPGITHITNEYEVEVLEPHFLTAPSTPVETKQNYNTDIISHIFYLANQEIIYTTYKVYNAVLYYKYFENLKMSVIELELDTPEYNLMILLPDFHTDLVAAAASLRLGPTLRLMRKQLKPRWVQAIIPDFKLHGAMFLTNDLQNLGISSIFEPNRADFRPMTDETGVYVKHIEQSINVNIRTRPINQLKRNFNAAQVNPIQISVNHPFLFFVIDRELNVAVMAGRILNPLNVRIQ